MAKVIERSTTTTAVRAEEAVGAERGSSARVALTLLFLVGGVALAAVSYLLFAAPLGTATGESFSNPRVPFAATLFIIGVVLAFSSALVYELLPSGRRW